MLEVRLHRFVIYDSNRNVTVDFGETIQALGIKSYRSNRVYVVISSPSNVEFNILPCIEYKFKATDADITFLSLKFTNLSQCEQV